MTLKSTFHIVLTVSILLVSLSASVQPGLDLPVSSYQEPSPLTLSAAPDFSVPQPGLACVGCSGNGGGPGGG
jgi:hypothetical protein